MSFEIVIDDRVDEPEVLKHSLEFRFGNGCERFVEVRHHHFILVVVIATCDENEQTQYVK